MDQKRIPPQVELTSEQKTIAGYVCKKALITQYAHDSSAEVFECYYSAVLPSVFTMSNNTAFKKIPGFVMEYKIKQGGLEMSLTVKKITPKKIPAGTFTIPSDYTIYTPQELMQLLGGSRGK
jgi:hypothetical protein